MSSNELKEDKTDWCTVSFPVVFWDEVHAIEKKLAERGISFDTGTGFGARDWQLDWSLRGIKHKELIDMLKEISPTLFGYATITPYEAKSTNEKE